MLAGLHVQCRRFLKLLCWNLCRVRSQEASCICRGNASRVMGMASAVQHDLWAAVERGDGARYAEISDELELQPAPRIGRRAAVPLRLGLLPSRGAVSAAIPPSCQTSSNKGASQRRQLMDHAFLKLHHLQTGAGT